MRVVQNSWASGELSPEHFGRQDMKQYFESATTLKNFIVRNNGSLARRPGTDFVADVTSIMRSGGRTFPFRFNSNWGCVILIVPGTAYALNVYGVLGEVGLVNNDIPIPYEESEIPEINYCQVNDTLFLVHRNHPPAKIWVDESTGSPAFYYEVLSLGGLQASITTCTGASGFSGGSKFTVYYAVTCLVDGVETLPGTAGSASIQMPWTENATVTLKISNYTPPAGKTATLYYIYRKLYGDYRRVGAATWTGADVTWIDDYKEEQSEGIPIPLPALANAAGNYPGCVDLVDQRLLFASTINAPNRVMMSNAGDFYSWNTHSSPVDSDAIDIKVGMTQFARINHVASCRRIVLFGETGEWILAAPDGGAIGPTDIGAMAHSFMGCSRSLPPIVANGAILFAGRDQRQVREYAYSLETDGMAGKQINILSRHLFEGRTIVDWCWQQFPDGIVWCAMSDGALLSLSYLPEQGVYAWSRHALGGDGKCLRVCATSAVDSATSEVFALVQRTVDGTRRVSLERMRPYARNGSSLSLELTGDCVFHGVNATADDTAVVFAKASAASTFCLSDKSAPSSNLFNASGEEDSLLETISVSGKLRAGTLASMTSTYYPVFDNEAACDFLVVGNISSEIVLSLWSKTSTEDAVTYHWPYVQLGCTIGEKSYDLATVYFNEKNARLGLPKRKNVLNGFSDKDVCDFKLSMALSDDKTKYVFSISLSGGLLKSEKSFTVTTASVVSADDVSVFGSSYTAHRALLKTVEVKFASDTSVHQAIAAPEGAICSVDETNLPISKTCFVLFDSAYAVLECTLGTEILQEGEFLYSGRFFPTMQNNFLSLSVQNHLSGTTFESKTSAADGVLSFFPFASVLETIMPEAHSGSVLLQPKKVSKVFFRLKDAGGGEVTNLDDEGREMDADGAWQALYRMHALEENEYGDMADAPSIADGTATLVSGWACAFLRGCNNIDGRIALRNSSPWPMDVLSFVEDMEVGVGKEDTVL